jgi:hypothetical protein
MHTRERSTTHDHSSHNTPDALVADAVDTLGAALAARALPDVVVADVVLVAVGDCADAPRDVGLLTTGVVEPAGAAAAAADVAVGAGLAGVAGTARAPVLTVVVIVDVVVPLVSALLLSCLGSVDVDVVDVVAFAWSFTAAGAVRANAACMSKCHTISHANTSHTHTHTRTHHTTRTSECATLPSSLSCAPVDATRRITSASNYMCAQEC